MPSELCNMFNDCINSFQSWPSYGICPITIFILQVKRLRYRMVNAAAPGLSRWHELDSNPGQLASESMFQTRACFFLKGCRANMGTHPLHHRQSILHSLPAPAPIHYTSLCLKCFIIFKAVLCNSRDSHHNLLQP